MPSPSPAPRVPERSSPSLVRTGVGRRWPRVARLLHVIGELGQDEPGGDAHRPRHLGGRALATRDGEWERSCARGKPGLSCGEGLAAGRGPGRPAKPAPGTCTLRNTHCLSSARSDPGLRGRHRRGGPLQPEALLHVQGHEGGFPIALVSPATTQVSAGLLMPRWDVSLAPTPSTTDMATVRLANLNHPSSWPRTGTAPHP